VRPCKLKMDITKSIPILHLHPVCSMDQTYSEPSNCDSSRNKHLCVDGSDVMSEVQKINIKPRPVTSQTQSVPSSVIHHHHVKRAPVCWGALNETKAKDPIVSRLTYSIQFSKPTHQTNNKSHQSNSIPFTNTNTQHQSNSNHKKCSSQPSSSAAQSPSPDPTPASSPQPQPDPSPKPSQSKPAKTPKTRTPSNPNQTSTPNPAPTTPPPRPRKQPLTLPQHDLKKSRLRLTGRVEAM
jgi:hypothetical protein